MSISRRSIFFYRLHRSKNDGCLSEILWITIKKNKGNSYSRVLLMCEGQLLKSRMTSSIYVYCVCVGVKNSLMDICIMHLYAFTA